MRRAFTRRERDSWPEGHKGCPICRKVKAIEDFPKGNSGRAYSYCHDCRLVPARPRETLPPGKKRCSTCKKVKGYPKFPIDDRKSDGRNAQCRLCQNEVVRARLEGNPEAYLYGAAKARAKKKGLPFTIQIEDVVIPDHCPVFGIPLVRNRVRMGPDSMSLDRIDSSRGYEPGNVAVISTLANTIKNNATARQLRAVADWMDSVSMRGAG